MLLVCGFTIITDGFDFDGQALAFGCGCGAIYSFVGSWVWSHLSHDAYSAEGVYGHSPWGRRRSVRWQDISSARQFWLLNLRLLRVYATDGKITLLGLFPAQAAEFRKEIRRLAPHASPILNHL
jgi:hypothetical protein